MAAASAKAGNGQMKKMPHRRGESGISCSLAKLAGKAKYRWRCGETSL
jgi:hypothetical protein